MTQQDRKGTSGPASTSNYFLQNYIYKHQKPLKITTAHNPNTVVYENQELEKSKKLQQAINKQIHTSVMEKQSTPQTAHQSTTCMYTENKNGPFDMNKPVPLTMKNVELYNSQLKKAQLSVPSKEDDRIVEWLNSRQCSTTNGVVIPVHDDIPELEEETPARQKNINAD